jgi:hypothetical protein
MHPQVIGRGRRMLMLNRLVEHMKERAGVRFSAMADVAQDWQRKHPLRAARTSR